jgi:16S rRNA G527 N7-methylase RsmG
MWKIMLGGLYPAAARESVYKVLSPRDENGGKPAILDVGSGPGFW